MKKLTRNWQSLENAAWISASLEFLSLALLREHCHQWGVRYRTFSVTSRPFSTIRPLISFGSQAAGWRDILTEPKLLARKNKTIEIQGMVPTVGSPSHLKRSPNVALLSLTCGRARRPYFGTSVGLAEKLRTSRNWSCNAPFSGCNPSPRAPPNLSSKRPSFILEPRHITKSWEGSKQKQSHSHKGRAMTRLNTRFTTRK